MLWRPWIDVAARYDWLDNPGQVAQRFHAVTAGFDMHARRLLELQAVYTHKLHYGPMAEGVPSVDDDVIMLVGQLALERTFYFIRVLRTASCR
jgi:hypothetical protein